jgi:AcrR family transcriptional regulator
MKRDDIINSAIVEFGKCDYDRASINSIIEDSNTSKGTFYHYFNSKEALYTELLDIVVKEKLRFLQEKTNETDRISEDPSIFELFRSQIRSSVEFRVAYPKYAMFSAQVANETNQAIRSKIEAVVGNATLEYLNPLVRTNIERQNLRNDVPEEFVSALLVYMLSHFSDFLLYMGVKVDSNDTPKMLETLNYYIDVLEHGLAYKR